MKKFFRKSLACIIAVMMIATSLPFSAITAGAATTKTDTISMNAFGAFKSGDASRVGADYISTCNDGQNTNFVMAVFTFDVSSLTVDSTDSVSAVFNYYTQFTQSENKGVSFYYPTQHLDEFNIANLYAGTPNSSIWTGDDSNHLSRAISYYNLQELQLNIAISSTKTNGQLQIGPAIKYAKRAGTSRAVVIGVIASAGQSGSGGGWTDTSIGYTNQDVTVNVTPNSLSDKEYIQAHINDVLPTYSDISSSQLEGVSNIPSDYIQGVKSIGAFNSGTINNTINDFDSTSSYHDFKIFGFNNPIAVYTGDGCVIRVPVNSENTQGGNKSGVTNYVGIDHLSITNSNFSLGRPTWERSESYTNFADNTDTSHNFSSASNGNVDRTENTGNNRFYVTDKKTWRNYITYTGTGNTDTYYDSISSISYDYQADYTWSWWNFGTKWGSKSNHTKTLSSNNSLYVINYAPLKSIIDNNLKKDYETISANEQIYTEASLASYYNAVANILKFDLMYGVSAYSSDVPNAVLKKGAEIKNLVNSYVLPEKKVFTVSFRTQTNNVIENRIIEYGKTIGAFPSNSAPQTHNDDPMFIDEGKHVRFSWPTTYTADTVVTSDINIKEVGNAESCTGTATCTAKAVCTVCGLEFGAIAPDNHDPIYNFKDYTNHIKTCSRCDLNVEEAHTDDGTGKCQYCGHVLLDTSTLESAKRQAKDILDVGNADGKYVADTYQKLSDVYNRIKDIVPASEEEVNSLTSELLEAISSLISANITITFTKVENGTQVGETQTINAKYGDPVEIPVNDGDVEKWEIVNNEGAENEVRTYVRTGENTLSIVVSENISVIAHLAVNSTSQQQNITKVVFMGRNKNVVAIKYIEPGKSFATSDVPIPAIPFYTAIAWDKTEVVGLENGGEIIVRAQYDFNVADADAHKCGIHYDGFEGKVRKYNYDSFVKLYNSSEYFGMYEDEAKTKLLTYFKTDEFYAPHNPNIYVAPVDASAVTASVGVTGSYQENYDTKDVAAFNCKFFVPDNAQIVEWGIKANAGGTTYNLKSNSKTSRNEYTFKVTVAKSTNISSVSAKAYIIYIDGAGKRTTLLSNNEVAINFN